MLRKIIAGFVLIMGAISPAFCSEVEVVGYIQEITGSPEDIKLNRAGEEQPVLLFMELYKGDKFDVTQPETQVKIVYSDNQNEVIDLEGSPYLVQGNGEAPGLSTNLMSWAGEWITGLYRDEPQRRLTQAISRGDNPHISAPLLMHEPLLMVGPRSDICLAWAGGLAPYRIQLRHIEHKSEFVEIDSISETKQCLEAELLPGQNYILSIHSAEKYIFETDLKIIGIEQLPATPSVSFSTKISPEMEATLYASWLSAQQNNRWLFESYQLLSSFKDQYRPAALVMQSLSEGRAPHSHE